MEWEGDEGNEPVPAWSCNTASIRRKPSSASHFQSHTWVHAGNVGILYVCSIWISRQCNIELHGRCLALFPHLQRCFLTWASQQIGESQCLCPENGTPEEAKGRRGIKFCNLDTVQDAVRNECLAGLYQPWDRCFHAVRCRLQLAKDPLDAALGHTDSSIRSLATVFCRDAWSST